MTAGSGGHEARNRPPGYFDLLRALRAGGCPACRFASESAWRYIDGILWEGVTDPGIRMRLRTSRGFCRDHGLLALQVAAKEQGQAGIAVIYEDLLARIEVDLSALSDSGRWWWRRGHMQAFLGDCPACVSADRSAILALSLLANLDQGPELDAAARGEGVTLCLPHLVRGLEIVGSNDHARRLRQLFGVGTQTLRGQLRESLRKRDYRFSHEPVSREESTAWARAVYAVVGAPMRPPRQP